MRHLTDYADLVYQSGKQMIRNSASKFSTRIFAAYGSFQTLEHALQIFGPQNVNVYEQMEAALASLSLLFTMSKFRQNLLDCTETEKKNRKLFLFAKQLDNWGFPMAELCATCGVELPSKPELEKHFEQTHTNLRPKIKLWFFNFSKSA